MNMEKYSKIIDEFSDRNCNVNEHDVIMSSYRTHKKSWKKLAVVVTCIMLVFVGTTSYAAGLIDLPGLFKKIFNDEVTGELIEEGVVYGVNLAAQNENYTITFEGITGDSSTQFGVFKLVDNTGKIGVPSWFELDVKIVGTSVLEEGRLSEYGRCITDSFTTLEDEVNAYYIKVNMPSYWIYDSEEDIYILLEGVTAYYGDIEYYPNSVSIKEAERILKIPFDFEYTFTPDRSVFPKSRELAIEKTLISDFSEFTLKNLEVSRYGSELIITFPNNEDIIYDADALALWHKIDNDYIFEYIETVKNYDEIPYLNDEEFHIIGVFTPESTLALYKTVKDPSKYVEGDIKIFVDGVEIARKKPLSYNWISAMDSTDNPSEWGLIIQFETFDIDDAKTIEVIYHDQKVKIK